MVVRELVLFQSALLEKRGYGGFFKNKVDVLHVRLTELHTAHQNLPPAIHTLRLKETIQNIHQK